MKRCAWVLSLAGVLRLLTGCATTDACKDGAFVPRVAQGTPTGFLNKSLVNGDQVWHYVVYVPENYTPDKAWPLIVFLHGAGERGDDGLKQSQVGIGSAIRLHPDRFPAIVIMPQCPEGAFWDVILERMETAMAQIHEEYRIDDHRVYLTGLSMGGYGTWLWGGMKTGTFAALMPICGGGDVHSMEKLLDRKMVRDFGTMEERVQHLAKVPIWAFHGAKDSVVPPEQSRQMVKLVKEAGGHVKYTEFPDTDHNSWDAAYQNEDAIEWLFKQKKP